MVICGTIYSEISAGCKLLFKVMVYVYQKKMDCVSTDIYIDAENEIY